MLAWQAQGDSELSLGSGLDAQGLEIELPVAKFDLSLSLNEQVDGSIAGALEFDASLFKSGTVRTWLAQFVRLTELLVKQSQAPLAEMTLINASQRKKVVVSFNDTERAYKQITLVELFERQAAKTPDAIGVMFGQTLVSYGELDARANRLARYLAGRGIGAEDVVAIVMDRSIDMLVSLLAVLKAGAAYLPMDPAYPIDRLSFMLQDSGACSLGCRRCLGDSSCPAL
jgi:non-ribosomal peptide synthetase component F